MEFLRSLESIRTPALDILFQMITLLGQEEFVLGILCFTFWCLNKKTAYQLAFTFFSSGLLVQTLKITFRIPRPWVLDPEFKAVKSAVPAATGYSFPSGHTQGGTSLFSVLMMNSKKVRRKLFCILAFVLIGFSRMYLGVHTPKDVFVSMSISFVFSWLMYLFMSRYYDDHTKDLLISIVLALICIIVALYAYSLLKNGTLDIKYAHDCFKAAGAGLGFSISWYIERTYICFSVIKQFKWKALGFFFGIAVVLILKFLIKLLIGSSLPADMIRYSILVLWIVVIYPYVFSRLSHDNL